MMDLAGIHAQSRTYRKKLACSLTSLHTIAFAHFQMQSSRKILGTNRGFIRRLPYSEIASPRPRSQRHRPDFGLFQKSPPTLRKNVTKEREEHLQDAM